jgi:hypothetical protein
MARDDPSRTQALHKWWDTFKRRNPESTPSPAVSFEAGFDAARVIYMKHAEKAMDELSRLKYPDTTGQ